MSLKSTSYRDGRHAEIAALAGGHSGIHILDAVVGRTVPTGIGVNLYVAEGLDGHLDLQILGRVG